MLVATGDDFDFRELRGVSSVNTILLAGLEHFTRRFSTKTHYELAPRPTKKPQRDGRLAGMLGDGS